MTAAHNLPACLPSAPLPHPALFFSRLTYLPSRVPSPTCLPAECQAPFSKLTYLLSVSPLFPNLPTCRLSVPYLQTFLPTCLPAECPSLLQTGLSTCRPNMTFAVYWALKANDLSTYLPAECPSPFSRLSYLPADCPSPFSKPTYLPADCPSPFSKLTYLPNVRPLSPNLPTCPMSVPFLQTYLPAE